MSCTFSRERLALHVGGDLSGESEHATARHLERCDDCGRFFEQLRDGQTLLKSLRRETVSASDCTRMRREVMAIINDARDGSGWVLRIERAITLAFRRRSYALASVALVGVVSLSVLVQLSHTGSGMSEVMFEGKDTLLRPEAYRDWTLVSQSAPPSRSGFGGIGSPTATRSHSVYINPSAYREYIRTGTFPDGTLMVWESGAREEGKPDRSHMESAVLLASVKDSTRFDEDWGFFDFTGREGKVMAKAKALPDSRGCRVCHQEDAKTDHVFTQFYPVLHAAQRSGQPSRPGRTATPEPLGWVPPSGAARLPHAAHL